MTARGTGPEVLSIGETMVMITPTDGSPLAQAREFSLHPGGAESNLVIYLALLGHRVSWASRLGDDALGRRVLADVGSYGVDTSLVELDPDAQTGVYFKDPAPGRPTQVIYYRRASAASRMSPGFLACLPLDGCALLHLTGITPGLSTSCRELTEAALDQAAEADLPVSFDVNYRPGVWSVAEAADVLLSMATRADLVLVGRDEAEVLWGTRAAADVRRLLPEVAQLVVKDGAVGATEFHSDRVTFVPTPKVSVVEPVGAGDAFAAGYLSVWLRTAEGDRETDAASSARLAEGHRLAGLALGSTADISLADAVRREGMSDLVESECLEKRLPGGQR